MKIEVKYMCINSPYFSIHVQVVPPLMIFEKEGVYLHTNAKRSNQDTTIPGFIRIVERVSQTSCVSGLLRYKDRRSIMYHVFVLGWSASFRVEPAGRRGSQCPCCTLHQEGQ